MPALLVSKSPPLSGEVTIHGAKNSVLPILAATLLCRTPCVLHNCPDILDVTHALAILCSLGCAAAPVTPSRRNWLHPCARPACFSARCSQDRAKRR